MNCKQEGAALPTATFVRPASRSEGEGPVETHLLDVVACLGAGLDEHDAQLLGTLLALLDADLPARHSTEWEA